MVIDQIRSNPSQTVAVIKLNTDIVIDRNHGSLRSYEQGLGLLKEAHSSLLIRFSRHPTHERIVIVVFETRAILTIPAGE